jgi:hypothetical protein
MAILQALELRAPQAVSYALLAHIGLPLITHALIALLELLACPRPYHLLHVLHAPLENTALAHLAQGLHIVKVVHLAGLIRILVHSSARQVHTVPVVEACPYNAL